MRMKILVIDSATEACSVALFDGDQLVAGHFEMLGRGHAEHLVPMIARLPAKGRADRIAVSLGPGSFTGVRVGVATARALAYAWNAQTIGYPALALVAAMARTQEGAVPVGVAMTGGHGEWFVEGFDAAGRTSRAFASLKPEDAAAGTTEAIVAGNEAQALVERRGHGRAVALWPDARQFATLPEHALRASAAPLYGRAPDARLPAAAR